MLLLVDLVPAGTGYLKLNGKISLTNRDKELSKEKETADKAE